MRMAWVLLLAIAACGNEATTDDRDDDAFALEGADASAAESDVQLVASSLVSASPGPIALALSETSLYVPRRCLTVSNDAASSTATFTFDRCLGPNGLRVDSGTIRAHYTASEGGLRLEVTGANLVVNEAAVAFSANAVIARSDAEPRRRTMTWQARIDGTSAGKRVFTRTNDVTIEWSVGDPCSMASGNSEGSIGGHEVTVAIESFRRCRRACPDAGGKITVTDVSRGKTIELRYDGSNVATYVAPNGKETPVPLLCRP